MKKKSQHEQAHPLVSIVITTRNEAHNIARCLQSIQAQSYPKNCIQVIVVDNNSTDKTRKIARKYTSNIFTRGPERSAQRNFGAKQSKGAYYMYLDADMSLSPNVVRESVKKFNNDSKIVGLYVPEIVTGSSFLSKVRRFERTFYNGTVIDAVRIVKMDTFKGVKGFDESMSGSEDWDFDKKIRQHGSVDIIHSPIYHNEAEFNIIYYVAKKGYYMYSFPGYIRKWGKEDSDLKKQLGIYYRFIGVFVEKNKWRKLLFHPVLTLGMYFLRVLIGIRYMLKRPVLPDKSIR